MLTIPKDTLLQGALQQLYNEIKNGGSRMVKFNQRENQIIMGDSVIRLKVKVEFAGQKEDKWVYAANFTTMLQANKELELNASAIGIGVTKQEAFNICIKEWMNNFGIPLSNLLNNHEPVVVGSLKVYPGNMGVRGELPSNTWLKGDKEMNNKIVSSISQVIKTNKNAIIPVDIKLLITAKGVSDGECRLGNFVSFELLKSLKKLNWPSTANKIIFSQYYLVENTANGL